MAVSKNLPQQAGLAGPPHANHRRSLCLDYGQPDVPAREHRQGRRLGVNDFLANDCAKSTFHGGLFCLDSSFLKGQIQVEIAGFPSPCGGRLQADE